MCHLVIAIIEKGNKVIDKRTVKTEAMKLGYWCCEELKIEQKGRV